MSMSADVSDQQSSHSHPRRLFSTASYRWWFAADTSSALGGSVTSYAFPLIVLALTGSPAKASLMGSIAMIVSATCELFGGSLQDAMDRRKLLVINGVAGLLIYSWACLFLYFDWFTFTAAIILAILQGLRSGLTGGVSNLLLRDVVPSEQLPQAMAVNQGRDAAIEFGGAPVGGLLLGISRVFPFLTTAILALIQTLSAWRLKGSFAPPPSEKSPISISGLFDGFRWILSSQLMRIIVFAGNPVFSLFNAAILITIMELVTQGSSETEAGFINTAAAVGVFLGSLLVSVLLPRVRGGVLTLIAFALPVVCVLAMSATTGLVWKLVLLVPALLLLPAGNSAMGAFQMLAMPKAVMGRAFASMGIYESLIGAAITALAGIGLQTLGYQTTMIIMGSLMALLFLPLLFSSEVRDIPLSDHLETYAHSLGYGEESPSKSPESPNEG